MIAVSLNVGGGVRLIKPAKLFMCMQTHYKHDEDGRTALGVCRHCFVLLSHTANIVTKNVTEKECRSDPTAFKRAG